MRAFKELAKIVTETAELTDVYGVARREYAERCWHFNIPIETITGIWVFSLEDLEIRSWEN